MCLGITATIGFHAAIRRSDAANLEARFSLFGFRSSIREAVPAFSSRRLSRYDVCSRKWRAGCLPGGAYLVMMHRGGHMQRKKQIRESKYEQCPR